MKLKCFVGVMMLCSVSQLHAQDTVHITLPEAEKQFLEKNIQLLAEKYNIDMARAGIIEARLYNNPTLTVAGSLYDPARNKVFNVSNSNGQYDVSLQQLIRLAGKRNKEIRLAETNASLSENRFYDLIRTLRYTLRSDFYEAFFLENSINGYQAQINSLENLSTAYGQLQLKGVVTLKDAVRIKSLLYTLKAEQASLSNQFNDLEASISLLLQDNNKWFVPEADQLIASTTAINNINVQSLIDSAYSNRADLLLAQRNVIYNQQNYNLQKALATPDLTIGGEFDKRGSFVDNASFLTLSMDLPFFKRNQSNIKSARLGVDQSKITVQLQQQTVENDVQRAYSKLLTTDKMLSGIDPFFQEQFDKLLIGITENFQKKNISLIEFTDFYESYKIILSRSTN